MKKIFYFLILILIVHCTLIIDNCVCQWVQTNGPDGGSIRCISVLERRKFQVWDRYAVEHNVYEQIVSWAKKPKGGER